MFDDYGFSHMGCHIDCSYQGDTLQTMKTIGERIRARRKAQGIARQADLGELIGIDQSVVSDIERGAGFGASVLMSLCDVLSTTPEYIMEGSERDDAGEHEVIAIYRRLDTSTRVALLAMARGLAGSPSRPTLKASGYGSALDGLEPLKRIGRAKPRKTRSG